METFKIRLQEYWDRDAIIIDVFQDEKFMEETYVWKLKKFIEDNESVSDVARSEYILSVLEKEINTYPLSSRIDKPDTEPLTVAQIEEQERVKKQNK